MKSRWVVAILGALLVFAALAYVVAKLRRRDTGAGSYTYPGYEYSPEPLPSEAPSAEPAVVVDEVAPTAVDLPEAPEEAGSEPALAVVEEAPELAEERGEEPFETGVFEEAPSALAAEEAPAAEPEVTAAEEDVEEANVGADLAEAELLVAAEAEAPLPVESELLDEELESVEAASAAEAAVVEEPEPAVPPVPPLATGPGPVEATIEAIEGSLSETEESAEETEPEAQQPEAVEEEAEEEWDAAEPFQPGATPTAEEPAAPFASAPAPDVASAPVPTPELRVAESLLDEGNTYFNVGQHDMAVERYTRAIETAPTLVSAYYNRANAYTRTGNYDAALTDYNRAIELNRYDADALNNRGMLHLYRGENDEALADFNAALAITPGDTTVIVNRGLALLHKDEPRDALKDFLEAVRIDFRDAAAHYGAAQALATVGDTEAAFGSLRHAFRHEPAYVREAAADPRLSSLQSNPEFARLLREFGRG